MTHCGRYFSYLIILTGLVLSNNLYSQSLADISKLLGVNSVYEIKVDNLSNAQIEKLMKEGNARGYNDNEIFSILELNNVPQIEISKLKLRYDDIKSNNLETIDTQVQQNEVLENTIVPDQQNDVLPAANAVDVFDNSKEYTYGKSIFKDGSIKFYERTIDKKAPENYILGVGDVISVNIWGLSDFSGSYTIQKWGGISDTNIDRIYLRGLTFEKAKSLLLARFGNVYDKRKSSYEITLSYSREIDVSMVGEVENPGTYKIPAVNSLFNSLTVCGGPSESGTLRNIQVLRDGKKIHTLDIYDYLMSPSEQKDFYLENGDIIYVPVSNNSVDIRGELKRPGKYELLEGEGINSLLAFSGGYTSNAFLKNIQIKRYIDNQYLKIIDLDLDSVLNKASDVELFDGDAIEIKSIDDGITDYVDIVGAINIPGRYEFDEGESVFGLIERANGLKENAYKELAYLVRTNGLKKDYIKLSLSDSINARDDKYKLRNQDLIRVFSLDEFEDSYQVEVLGLVRSPQVLVHASNMTLYDAIVLAGGLKYDADSRIEISRLNKESETAEVYSIFVEVDIENYAIVDNQISQIELEPFDRIFVREKVHKITDDLVSVLGEVKYPGKYSLNKKDEKISELIERAGGLTNLAQTNGATFFREDNGLGNVILKLDEALDRNESTYNYTLKGGDILTIPAIENFVSVKGAIDYPLDSSASISAPWVPSKSAKFYVNEYGNGFSKNADKKRTYVLQANREISRTKKILFFKNYPKVDAGGVVYVLSKQPKIRTKTTAPRNPVNWNQLAKDVLTAATAAVPLIIVLLRD